MKTLKAVSKANTTLLTLFTLAIGLLFTACDGVNDNEGTGTLRVHLTDAPGDYAEVNIEIHQVLVKRAEQDENEEETEGMDDEELENAGWEVIYNDTMMVNLLDYQNGKTLPLGEVELESGFYNQIRLVLGDGNTVVLNEGGTFDLRTPSGQTSGFKLLVNADIEEGDEYDLVIDFDASQSVVALGNGLFNLKPVLRTVELDNTGSISGVVMPVEAQAWVYTVTTSDDTVSTTPDENGAFTLIGLNDGTYNIWVEAGNEMYADSSITGITIETNEDFAIEDTLYLRMLDDNQQR